MAERRTYGSGIGQLLTNLSGGVENARSRRFQEAQLANQIANQQRTFSLQERQLGFQDPNRTPSFLELAQIASKDRQDPLQNLLAATLAQQTGVPFSAPPTANLMDTIRQLQQAQTQFNNPQQQVPQPQPSAQAPVSRGTGNLQAIADEMRKRGLFQ
jgi:hypothetical protein